MSNLIPKNESSEPPKPWMASEEIAAIEKLLEPDDRMLEFGSGRSTLWLSSLVKEIHSIEHNASWAAEVSSAAASNVHVHCREPEFAHVGFTPAKPGQFESYLAVPDELQIEFDVALIDGRARIEAAVNVAPCLRSGGWLFFHDWYNRERYYTRQNELTPYYTLVDELSITETPQTLAIFRRTPEQVS